MPNMPIIELIVTVVGFVVLFIYQKQEIKNLKDQSDIQTGLITNINTYFHLLDPEVIRLRVELFEKNIEKEAKIEINKIQEEAKEKINYATQSREKLTRDNAYLLGAVIDALFYVSPQKRKEIIGSIEQEGLRDMLQALSPTFEKSDRERFRFVFKSPLPVGSLMAGGLLPEIEPPPLPKGYGLKLKTPDQK